MLEAAEQVWQTLTNVHCRAAEKPADEILEVLNSNNFKHFVLIISFFIASS